MHIAEISPELLQQIQDMAADLDNMDQVKTYVSRYVGRIK